MTRRRLMIPLFLVGAALAGADTRGAQQPAAKLDEVVFTFALEPSDKNLVADPNTELQATAGPRLRPNYPREVFLYARNPTKVERTFSVEIRGEPGVALAATTKVKIPAERWARVRFPKPPAPPAPTVVIAAPQPAAPAPPPPPPGVPLRAADGEYTFTLRLTDDADAERSYSQRVRVAVRSPEEYFDPNQQTLTLTRLNLSSAVKAEVQAKERAGEAPYVVDMTFPNVPESGIRAGIYRATLSADPGVPDALPKGVLRGEVVGGPSDLRVAIGVDGVRGAFVYQPQAAGDQKTAVMVRDTSPAVRVVRADGRVGPLVTQPVAKLPVRVEVDNAKPGDTLDLLVRPEGEATEVGEVVRLGPPADERVWLDVSGPLDGGFLFSNKRADWVWELDVRALRGRHQILGRLRPSQPAQGGTITVSQPLPLVVDATPPEVETIRFGKLPAKHVRGTPLRVRAWVSDPETAVTKAVFFLGRLDENGKLPPTVAAVAGTGVEDEDGAITWEADLPLPADKKGPVDIDVGVQFTNAAGLTSADVQRVTLVDAPPPEPPSGTIEGVVLLGGRPQAGLPVSLTDADGKEKGAADTDAKGAFKFEKVPPGTYKVGSAKKDSGEGSRGADAVQVEVGKTTKATVNLTRMRR